MTLDHIFLYGPPGSGKTTIGRLIAQQLNRPFTDLDETIAAQAGASIPEIFALEGEAGFRARELAALEAVLQEKQRPRVIALGGGALLAPQARATVENSGQVLCLYAAEEVLLARVAAQAGIRPLLSGVAQEPVAERLRRLLEARREHYCSFPRRLDTGTSEPDRLVWQALIALGRFHVRGMGAGYDVSVEPGVLARLGAVFRQQGLEGPVALVCDQNVAGLFAGAVADALRAGGYEVQVLTIPAGEDYKTIETVQALWAGFARMRLERGSTVLALGGGVVGDLAGFAAATFLRGVSWVNAPTTLLAMVDSSLGGKTGFDLPQGKNLVGAFHPPRLVVADPQVLATLPARELRSGLAETIKHGVIDDPGLFALCEQGEQAAVQDLDALVRRGMAVKVRVIEADPYEKGIRQALNLGHTLGHGIEIASGFRLSHGEAVAIGMAVETRLAEQVGVAENGLAERICAALRGLNLPVAIPHGLPRGQIVDAMQLDKKRANGKVRFALPERVGSVRVGVEIENWQTRIFEA